MDFQSLQIDLERARNLQRSHGGSNFRKACLILVNVQCLCWPVDEFAFQIRQRTVQLVDTTKIWPAVNARSKTNEGKQCQQDRNDKEDDTSEKRAQPKRGVALPKGRPRAVKRCGCRRQRQVVGLLRREFTEIVEAAGSRVDFTHCFEQQILQSGVKSLSHK